MIDLNVKLSKKNDDLERNVIEFHSDVKATESENERIIDEMNMFRRKTSKSNRCETYDLLGYEIESLSKFIKY